MMSSPTCPKHRAEEQRWGVGLPPHLCMGMGRGGPPHIHMGVGISKRPGRQASHLGRSCLLPSGTPRNSILRALSLAFNFDIFQKLPRTKATLPWL